ncbi:hypothetical protein L7F22_062000 [Adiantum nelumboides]|nr:hypothetical protein [Adiantum nelumboides]
MMALPGITVPVMWFGMGGVAMYVATRGLYRMKPPTVVVPKCIKETVEKLFEVYRQLDGSELKHNLIGLDVGETYNMGKALMAKAFKTYHVIPSQGYIIYSVRHKLKAEYLGLPGNDIKNLKESGVEEPRTKGWLFDTLVTPALMYASAIWGPGLADSVWTQIERPQIIMI